jgi:hypothetical protein
MKILSASFLLHRVPTESTFQVNEHKILYTKYNIFIPLPDYIPQREMHNTKARISSLPPYYGSYFSVGPKPSGSHHMVSIYTSAYILQLLPKQQETANYTRIKKIK